MKRIEKVFLLLFTIIAVQAVAVAEANAGEAWLSELDEDQDGYISLKEAVADTRLLRLFSRIDDNADGQLSIDELKASEEGELLSMRASAK